MPTLNCTAILIFSELGTLNSGFTKVSSTDDDCNETFRREQTRATFLPIDPQFYMLNLQKLLNLM